MADLPIPTKIRPPHPSKGMSKAAYKAHRKKHVKAWQASGQTKTHYAARIGISKDAFCDWVRAFGATRASHPRQSNPAKNEAPKQTQPAAIIPVRIPSDNNATVQGQITLVLTNGITLEWTQLPQAAWLAELLKSLA